MEAGPFDRAQGEQTAFQAAFALIDAQVGGFAGLVPLITAAGFLAALLGGAWALMLYRRGKQREAARWMHDLFVRFQSGNEFDRAKLIFDFEYRSLVEPIHATLVAGGKAVLDPCKRAESHAIDRLLNYLEHVIYLADQGHIQLSDCMACFKHWFEQLSAPERGALRRYLVISGHERLARIAGAGADDFLLLYGSLGRHEPMHGELALDKALEFVGLRAIPGTLYDLGEYPGLVLGQGLASTELYRIRDLSVLLRLDDYEEYDHANPDQSLFRRTTLQLPRYHSALANRLHGSPKIDAWIYLYNQPTDSREIIAATSWREHKLRRQAPEFPPG